MSITMRQLKEYKLVISRLDDACLMLGIDGINNPDACMWGDAVVDLIGEEVIDE